VVFRSKFSARKKKFGEETVEGKLALHFFQWKKARNLPKQIAVPSNSLLPLRAGLNANTFGVGVACKASDYLFH